MQTLNRLVPHNSRPLGTVTANHDAWDSNDKANVFALPVGSVFVDVSLNQRAHIMCDDTEDQTAYAGDVPAIYDGDANRIPCVGKAYLHFKNAAAGVNATVCVTAFGNF
ncbi:MAG TPA: hypothetical protein VM487_00555 [Phycisphaerae bacterium]|nr:hypothetical protein [Phycisphaerae bacterium]